ncbi:hypothetical protein BU16DRAFT_116336 [Lophium mytilinum]|uniref:Uncharacterized protein n=1 Tax=Lophium mytilinum TaxID=390894 RepID=A0A6A6QH12_9PEZI|nr:hypothetical protein BU16DRAFT_116336 [Lophium mytilinum]
MDKTIQVLDEEDPDLKAQLGEYSAIDPFLDLEKQFEMEDAARLHRYCQLTWPEMDWVNPERILLIRQSMCRSRTRLPYGWLRPFLSEMCYALSKSLHYEKTDRAMVKVLAMCERLYFDAKSLPSVSLEKVDGMLDAVRAKLLERSRMKLNT